MTKKKKPVIDVDAEAKLLYDYFYGGHDDRCELAAYGVCTCRPVTPKKKVNKKS